MNNVRFIEVRVEPGGWKVTAYFNDADPRILSHHRRKKIALLVGTGAAELAQCERKVTDKHGVYTTEATSHGNDPHPPKG